MKKIFALLMALVIALNLCVPAMAATTEETKCADALNVLNVFRGNSATQKDYALDRELSRVEGVALFIRLLGAEDEAESGFKSGKYKYTFSDQVPDWSKPVVSYANAQNLVIGIGNNRFGNGTMDKKMLLTLALRALGYTSTAEGGDFKYVEAERFATSLGLSVGGFGNVSFDRGDAVRILWQAVNTKMKNSQKTLGETLAEQNVFTTQRLAEAKAQYENSGSSTSGGNTSGGNTSGGGTSGGGTSGGGTATPDDKMTWEKYSALSAEEQMEFYLSFENPADFFDWMNQAKAEYEENNKPIVIGEDGVIDLGKLLEGQDG